MTERRYFSLSERLNTWVNAPGNAGANKRLRLLLGFCIVAVPVVMAIFQSRLGPVFAMRLSLIIVPLQWFRSALVTDDEKIEKASMAILRYQKRLKRHGKRQLKIIQCSSIVLCLVSIIGFTATIKESPTCWLFLLAVGIAAAGIFYGSKPVLEERFKDLKLELEKL
ncbi:MAG: hypothetical protein ACQKBW_12830 [Puniceicoccales bacterium]